MRRIFSLIIVNKFLMEIKGKLIKILPLQTGQGRNGEWKRQEFVIEVDGTYPKKVCCTCWGDKVDLSSLVEGSVLNISFDIESREYQERWYTSIIAWKVEQADGSQSSSQPMPPIEAFQPDDMPPVKDDLPF